MRPTLLAVWAFDTAAALVPNAGLDQVDLVLKQRREQRFVIASGANFSPSARVPHQGLAATSRRLPCKPSEGSSFSRPLPTHKR